MASDILVNIPQETILFPTLIIIVLIIKSTSFVSQTWIWGCCLDYGTPCSPATALPQVKLCHPAF